LPVGGKGGRHFSPVLNACSDRQYPSLLTQKILDRVVGAKYLEIRSQSQNGKKLKSYYCQTLFYLKILTLFNK
jgi:hypothetical protein